MNGGVIGYRLWHINRDHGLCPLSYGNAWTPGVNMSSAVWCSGAPGQPARALIGCRCPMCDPTETWRNAEELVAKWVEPADHPRGHKTDSCTCGFYLRTLASARGEIGTAVNIYGGIPFIAGAVVCDGRIVRHRDGFRAQRAEIVALMPVPMGKPTIQLWDWRSAWHNAEQEAAELASTTATRYGVPLLPEGATLDDLALVAREHGVEVEQIPDTAKRNHAKRQHPALTSWSGIGVLEGDWNSANGITRLKVPLSLVTMSRGLIHIGTGRKVPALPTADYQINLPADRQGNVEIVKRPDAPAYVLTPPKFDF